MGKWMNLRQGRLFAAAGLIGGYTAADALTGVVDDLQEGLIGAGVGLGEHVVVDGGQASGLLHLAGQGVHVLHLGAGHVGVGKT